MKIKHNSPYKTERLKTNDKQGRHVVEYKGVVYQSDDDSIFAMVKRLNVTLRDEEVTWRSADNQMVKLTYTEFEELARLSVIQSEERKLLIWDKLDHVSKNLDA